MLSSVVKRVVVWRLALMAVILGAAVLIPFKYSFPYVETLLEPQGHPVFWALANFDGVHYLGIANKGYFAQFTQVFFPVYPLIMRWINLGVRNFLVSGYLISLISLCGFLYCLYKLVLLDFSKKIAERLLVYYLLFPTAFFLAAVYTESLFMLLVVGCFLAARRKRWLLAGILGAVASGTRVFGILLLPALLIELWWQQKDRSVAFLLKRRWKELVAIGIVGLGLGFYMIYLAKNFSDPLYFMHVQPVFGAQRSGGKLILLYQVFGVI